MNSGKLMSRRDWTRLALATSVAGIGTAQAKTSTSPAAPARTESRSQEVIGPMTGANPTQVEGVFPEGGAA
jgi:hypothetical protein